MIPISFNVWSYLDGNANIRAGYPFSLEHARPESWRNDLWALKWIAGVGRIRTGILLAERDNVPTDFLHVPILPAEVEVIRNFINNCPLNVEIAYGFLWESVFLSEEQGVPLGDNPYHTPEELAAALVESVRLIVEPGLKSGTRIDLYNEWDVALHQQAVTDIYLPQAAAICKAAGVPWTVSAIVEPSGFTGRVIETNRYLQSLGLKPEFVEFHWNGCQPGQIEDNCDQVIGDLLMNLPYADLPLVLGECDAEMDGCELGALLMSGASEVILWQ
jgi:hypothetical protein